MRRSKLLAPIAAGVALALAACGGDDSTPQQASTPATTSPATTATAEVVPRSTNAPSTAPVDAPEPTVIPTTSAADPGVTGPIEEPLDGVAILGAAWANRDLETLLSITVDDVRVVSDGFTPSLVPFTEFHWANNTTWDIGECETSDNVLGGDYRVRCVLTITDDFFSAGDVTFMDASLAFVLDDGYITSLAISSYGPGEAEVFDAYTHGFLDWLRSNHREAFEMTIDPLRGQIFTRKAALVYVDYVDEWLATRD